MYPAVELVFQLWSSSFQPLISFQGAVDSIVYFMARVHI